MKNIKKFVLNSSFGRIIRMPTIMILLGILTGSILASSLLGVHIIAAIISLVVNVIVIGLAIWKVYDEQKKVYLLRKCFIPPSRY